MKIEFDNLYKKKRRLGFAIIFSKGKISYKWRVSVLLGIFVLSITQNRFNYED